ncbi:toprim domain-containing protein [Kribbella sandramycini]|uniref:DNA primase n=1 Tax=Kribbella sandramycini TaxID=60450 RepID=A0A7Y4P023_9ACTN|nr:toprim domain-containing protein [Kribbella sandramycini]MBB6566656.1 DNA primase [Kribbella sandramycini]NOL42692.1 toprim domain-containing protein [Kribbella sandramycini]
MVHIAVELHRRAQVFYRGQLERRPDGWAAAHLRERGLGALLTAPGWCVGYAPAAWSGLTDHLRGAGFSGESLVAAGLAVPTMNGYLVDRFQDRIMFAVENADLEVVGFSGRSRGGRMRYLHGPTTEVYRKSEATVGMIAQRGKLLNGAVPVLVEGVMDAAAVDQLGAGWAGISTCGTAVSAQQAAMIRRWSPANQIVVAFDPDLGGRLGAVRSLEPLGTEFGAVRAAVVPQGHDVASLFQESPGRLRECLGSAVPLAEFAIDVELAKWERVLDHLSGQVNALRAVVPFVRQLPALQVAREIARLSERLNIEPGVVTRELLTPARDRSARRGRGAGAEEESWNRNRGNSRTP